MASAVEQSEQELREKKRVLAALVVHDLRSPLTGISGCLELVKAELGADPANQHLLAYLDDAELLVRKTLGLVATILDVDELEDGILRAHLTPVRVRELVERAHAGNRAQFEVRDMGFEIDCDPTLVAALDRDLVGRVLENLIDNGARYASRRGRCAVQVLRVDDCIEIAVGNSGPPVPLAEREAIFGRFYQVQARRAAARANRGLGLYFCKLAAEAHGGTIHVESRGDLGAVFVVRIPQAA